MAVLGYTDIQYWHYYNSENIVHSWAVGYAKTEFTPLYKFASSPLLNYPWILCSRCTSLHQHTGLYQINLPRDIAPRTLCPLTPIGMNCSPGLSTLLASRDLLSRHLRNFLSVFCMGASFLEFHSIISLNLRPESGYRDGSFLIPSRYDNAYILSWHLIEFLCIETPL